MPRSSFSKVSLGGHIRLRSLWAGCDYQADDLLVLHVGKQTVAWLTGRSRKFDRYRLESDPDKVL